MNPSHPEPLHPLRISTGDRGGSNLALALFLLPSGRRKDAFLFHDFCRTVDDIADSPILGMKEKQRALTSWLAALQPGAAKNLPADFHRMIARRNLDRHLLCEIIRGMQMDVEGEVTRYATFGELRKYCWRVASAVGLVSAQLFGAHGAAVDRYAEKLGIALQLTNILRDVAEDALMNRIYLPMEDLERFGMTEADILHGASSPGMTHLLGYLAERADSYFAKAELAWSEMSLNQKRLMRPARLMGAIYRDLLLKMHRDCYDVFHRRYRVGLITKAFSLLRYFLQP